MTSPMELASQIQKFIDKNIDYKVTKIIWDYSPNLKGLYGAIVLYDQLVMYQSRDGLLRGG